jgi:subfamily B ATP-binding cassette protein MsbA
MPRATPAARGTGARLAAYAWPLRSLLGLCALLLLLRAATEPVTVSLAGALIDAIKQAQPDLGTLTRTVELLLVLGVVVAVTEFGSMYLADYVAQSIIRALRGDLFAHIQALSLGYFEDASTGMLVSRATNDLNIIQARLDFELTRLVKCPLAVAGLTGVMLWYSARLTLFALLVVGLLVPLLGKASRLMRRHIAALQDRLAEMTERLQESIVAIRVVQCFGATDYEIARFEEANAATRRAMMRAVRVRAFVRPIIHLVGLLGLLFVVTVGGWMAVRQQTISLGAVAVVLGSLQLITIQFKELGRARLALAEVLAAAEKVFALLDQPPDITDAPGALALGALRGRIVFEGVSFAYRSGGPVLSDIDLAIEPGQLVALVGASGAGKSSLVNLVPRLYDVTAGRVVVDGHDVRTVTRASLRAHLGIVPQQTMLFRGTIAENIAYARPAASRDEIVAAAVAANADRFIAELDAGYDTQVGERGAKLSGGQAQRIAIARAILRDPRILILDEATSSLDSASEALVQEALERLMAGRTCLVIAHRLSTILNADRIVVLDAGRIVETGTHAELLARGGGFYRRAYALQTGGGDEP